MLVIAQSANRAAIGENGFCIEGDIDESLNDMLFFSRAGGSP